MIISASRRTDIPAFYGEWFYNRLLEKEFVIRNPRNPRNVSRIIFEPEDIDCIVFWTKNPKHFFPYLDRIDNLGYNYYFQFTLTSYGSDIEQHVDRKSKIIDTFIQLADRIGKAKIIWRYDPILINSRYSFEYHEKWFDYLCEKLYRYTEKCVISFIDVHQYSFLKNEQLSELTIKEVEHVIKIIADIAKKYDLQIAACAETDELEKYGIVRNKCIDNELINKLCNKNLVYQKDTSQRKECGCTISRDIGVYNTCLHNCMYCYAKRQTAPHGVYDPKSPLLYDVLSAADKITTLDIRKKNDNIELFS